MMCLFDLALCALYTHLSQPARIESQSDKQFKASSLPAEVHLVHPPLLRLYIYFYNNPLIHASLAELSVLFSKSHTLSPNPPPPLSQNMIPGLPISHPRLSFLICLTLLLLAPIIVICE